MLSVGIVGLPNVGKSTLFNALLKKQQALAANYPFATIEPNIGVVPVPDERLEQLADLVKAEEKMAARPPLVPAVVKFVDIAGLVKGASQGEGLGNQFLSHIREVDAIVEVVRDFHDENVIRAGAVDPESDIATVNLELALADLQVVEKRLAGLDQEKRRVGGISTDRLATILGQLQTNLNQGRLVRDIGLNDEDNDLIRGLNLLTAKPLIYALNSDESRVESASLHSGLRGQILSISAKLEAELSELSEADQAAYLQELGVKERGLDKVIRAAYDILGLIHYFTAGPKEVRAWTIKKGDSAPVAAGKIHTDFERGFIAAEVIPTESLIAAGSYKAAKDAGQLRLEGRDYVVCDGDVIEFRFSV